MQVRRFVVLRGLTVDGLGTGSNGVVFNSGGSLSIEKCYFQNFAGSGTGGNGILLQPTSGTPRITISDSSVSKSAYVGVYMPPSSVASPTVQIYRVVASNNQFGISLYGGPKTLVSVTNSIAKNNGANGFELESIARCLC